jgi:hypothetical protein
MCKKIQINLSITTTLGTQKYWSLLTGGRYSEKTLCFKSSKCDQLINELLENPEQVQLVNRKFRYRFQQLFCRNFGNGFGFVLKKPKFQFISVTVKFQFWSFTSNYARLRKYFSFGLVVEFLL